MKDTIDEATDKEGDDGHEGKHMMMVLKAELEAAMDEAIEEAMEKAIDEGFHESDDGHEGKKVGIAAMMGTKAKEAPAYTKDVNMMNAQGGIAKLIAKKATKKSAQKRRDGRLGF